MVDFNFVGYPIELFDSIDDSTFEFELLRDIVFRIEIDSLRKREKNDEMIMNESP